MSDTIEETPTRQFDLQLSIEQSTWHVRSDGRSVRGRIIPFGEVATVFERGERYLERFLPGCCERMMQWQRGRGNAGWIGFNFEHDESIDARIGHAATLDVQGDGVWADFRVLPQRDLDKVRAMLEESHTGLSVMFDDIAPYRVLDGVRSRVQVMIKHVAATAWPVYRTAQIAQIRSDEGSELTAVEIDDRPALREVQAWLEAQRTQRSTS